MMMTTIVISSLLFYSLALTLEWRFLHHIKSPFLHVARLGGLVACGLHFLILYYLIEVAGGQNLNALNLLSLLTALNVLLALALPISLLRLLSYGLAIGVVASSWLATPMANVMRYHDALQLTHVFSSILAYSLLWLSALHAGLLALQQHQLHHKQWGELLNRLPPLHRMESIFFRNLALCVFLLSLSLVTGFTNMASNAQTPQKIIFSLVAYGLLISMLAGHYILGWRGKKTIFLTLFGFLFVGLGYFGRL